jgi:glyoxylase-like metal-dependent hydrolase (beta-lactamase superfamily II)
MPEELYPDLYRIKIPLPGSPLKYLNSYAIRGGDGERNLLVDTGLNREECKTAMLDGLAEIEMDLEKTDIFITHLHADHFGLLSELVTPSTRIHFNRPDTELIENWQGFEPMIRYAAVNGFPEAMLRDALHQHPGFKYGSQWIPALNIINDGDRLDVRQYNFTCIQTPGHTNGHTCLYESRHKFLIAGDHILDDITPNIQCWSDDGDPLRSYIESLDKIYDLDVERVLPGHRRIFENFRGRIDELKRHHTVRLDEIRDILAQQSPLSAYAAASRMTWDIEADSWENFPVAQKWFATGEALSHLRYLERRQQIRRTATDPVVTFSPAD